MSGASNIENDLDNMFEPNRFLETLQVKICHPHEMRYNEFTRFPRLTVEHITDEVISVGYKHRVSVEYGATFWWPQSDGEKMTRGTMNVWKDLQHKMYGNMLVPMLELRQAVDSGEQDRAAAILDRMMRVMFDGP